MASKIDHIGNKLLVTITQENDPELNENALAQTIARNYERTCTDVKLLTTAPIYDSDRGAYVFEAITL